MEVVQVWVGKRTMGILRPASHCLSPKLSVRAEEEFGLFLMPEGEEKRMRKRKKKGGEGCDGRGPINQVLSPGPCSHGVVGFIPFSPRSPFIQTARQSLSSPGNFRGSR